MLYITVLVVLNVLPHNHYPSFLRVSSSRLISVRLLFFHFHLLVLYLCVLRAVHTKSYGYIRASFAAVSQLCVFAARGMHARVHKARPAAHNTTSLAVSLSLGMRPTRVVRPFR